MSVNTRPAMRPTVAVFAVQTLMQDLKRPPSPVSPEPERDAS
jgi:hypothetical protein